MTVKWHNGSQCLGQRVAFWGMGADPLYPGECFRERGDRPCSAGQPWPGARARLPVRRSRASVRRHGLVSLPSERNGRTFQHINRPGRSAAPLIEPVTSTAAQAAGLLSPSPPRLPDADSMKLTGELVSSNQTRFALIISRAHRRVTRLHATTFNRERTHNNRLKKTNLL